MRLMRCRPQLSLRFGFGVIMILVWLPLFLLIILLCTWSLLWISSESVIECLGLNFMLLVISLDMMSWRFFRILGVRIWLKIVRVLRVCVGVLSVGGNWKLNCMGVDWFFFDYLGDYAFWLLYGEVWVWGMIVFMEIIEFDVGYLEE